MSVRGGGEFKAPTLVDAVAGALRRQILLGNIAAGESLTEGSVATRFSVARPTAKAAIERLIHDGILSRLANKTARVPLLVTADIDDLYRTRAILEEHIVSELAARRLVPEGARRSLLDLKECIEVHELNRIVEADIKFHLALVSCLESPRLSKLYESLIGEVHLCMAQVQKYDLLKPTRIMEEHEQILAAIESGHAANSVEAMGSHINEASKRLQLFSHKNNNRSDEINLTNISGSVSP